MCPLHRFYGGNGMTFELSSVAMGNVMMRHPWLYYVHAVIVNLVTFTVIHFIYGHMNKFLKWRFQWLKNLPAPRCTSVLVEGIPEHWRSDAKLHDFFSAMFGEGAVKEAVMVKKAPELLELYTQQRKFRERLQACREEWEQAKAAAESKGVDERDAEEDLELRPKLSQSLGFGPQIDAIRYYEAQLANLDPAVENMRQKKLQEAENVGGINSSAGFVTFHFRRQALAAENTKYSSDIDQWVVSTPPPASDVLWNDLKQDEHGKRISSVLAIVCTTLCYVLFLPAVLFGTNCAELVDAGMFQPLWDSYAPSLSLMLFLAFLPSVFLFIFRTFFTLKADIFAQHKLQIWYFFFNFFFVVLVTTIGKSILLTFAKILERPSYALEIMADNMPTATHFYMDFLMLQWGEQAVIFLRHMNLIKYLFFLSFHDEEQAKKLAEPEDQDYYGIGARSARFTVNMLIGIIFSTLSPLIAILTLILFYICRLFYGYLVVFAEDRKPDLGGMFYVTALRHLMIGLCVYNLLMIGVLSPSPIGRAASSIPMFIALPSIFYTVYCYFHFSNGFMWLDLPFEEFVFHQDEMKRIDNGLRYIQDEFMEDKERERHALTRQLTERHHHLH